MEFKEEQKMLQKRTEIIRTFITHHMPVDQELLRDYNALAHREHIRREYDTKDKVTYLFVKMKNGIRAGFKYYDSDLKEMKIVNNHGEYTVYNVELEQMTPLIIENGLKFFKEEFGIEYKPFKKDNSIENAIRLFKKFNFSKVVFTLTSGEIIKGVLFGITVHDGFCLLIKDIESGHSINIKRIAKIGSGTATEILVEE